MWRLTWPMHCRCQYTFGIWRPRRRSDVRPAVERPCLAALRRCRRWHGGQHEGDDQPAATDVSTPADTAQTHYSMVDDYLRCARDWLGLALVRNARGPEAD